MKKLMLLVALTVLLSCKQKSETIFTSIDSTTSGIIFKNEVQDTDSLSILDYLYYYNGAGVAVGDINNDSLPDIFFTANNGKNKLYLNKGNLIFEDITTSAGGLTSPAWSSGVVMADINADGLLDIYVSVVGDHYSLSGNRTSPYFAGASNKLFINNGNLSFREASNEYGLDIKGYNTQAVFFDADKDGDLDMFQLQHSVHSTDVYGDTSLRKKYSASNGGKYYRNDSGKFTDATKESGIISSSLGYGLGVSVADFNHDGWDDIYVGNDFHENDYYYLNDHGRFIEQSAAAFGHTSNFSMGNDAADINHDGWFDIFSLDMLPEDEKNLKSSQGDRPLDTYKGHAALGFNFQNARNCLQLNVGKGKAFSEIGIYAGVAATDWSWSPLLADFTLDGNVDLFISNGIKSRLNDLDYVKFLAANSFQANTASIDKKILEQQPDGKWHNYFFTGSDSIKFEDQSTAAGFDELSLSNGAAYADLDRDGDLDIVINNFNSTASLFRNNSKGNWLQIKLKGNALNPFAVGAKAVLFSNGKKFIQQLQPVRGFMSSVEPILSFGLGDHAADSLLIIFPDNKVQWIKDIPINSLININYKHAQSSASGNNLLQSILEESDSSLFKNITSATYLNFIHRENDFDDFNRQWFIPHQLSARGPAIAVADVNNDGLEDVFIGGGKNQRSQIFIQNENARFFVLNQEAIWADSASEDVDAVFFDVDNDHDNDLYVVSGGYEYPDGHPSLMDRLYINDGNGSFKRSYVTLPSNQKSCVTKSDFDMDGDIDLFVGVITDAKVYGINRPSHLLVNENGSFKILPLKTEGVITDAEWVDVDNDRDEDLVLVGEWISPLVYINEHGELNLKTKFFPVPTGWWQSISAFDINKDGRKDLILGNYGLNSKLTPAKDAPLKMFLFDPDNNNSADQVLAVEKGGNYYTFLGKEDLEKQLPYLKKEYLSYREMAGKSMQEIFGNKLQDAIEFNAESFSSLVIMSKGNGYELLPLPFYQQQAPVMEACSLGDNKIFVVGNFYGVMPYEGRYDALFPSIVEFSNRNIHSFPLSKDQLIRGEFRKIRNIRIGNKPAMILAQNNGPVIVFSAP
jgi:enediyne biosynthesis protein E4